ncbi:MAG: 16S rRNA processing protein RimM [Hyphomonadaceae bacterium]|nr:16S rRNA processing protein RimM [Hyphomonadaceae bacterium]
MNENATSQSDRDALFCVAAIAGALGVCGEIKIRSFTGDPLSCLSYGPLMDATGKVILTPQGHRLVRKFIAVRAPEISLREQAEALKSTRLYVPRAALPKPEEDEFYYSDLAGLDVEHVDGRIMGKLKTVHDFGAGDMLEIKPDKGPSWFHPFTKATVPVVDMRARRLVVEIVEPDVAIPSSEGK